MKSFKEKKNYIEMINYLTDKLSDVVRTLGWRRDIDV